MLQREKNAGGGITTGKDKVKKYKHIIFDLDRTLWDFDTSSRETLQEAYSLFLLAERGVPGFARFMDVYHDVNDAYWALYRKGEITKTKLNVQRFHDTLKTFGVDDRELAGEMASYYVWKSPLKQHLFPDAHELLEYLHGKYHLHILTNGFKEVQKQKVKANGLEPYFEHVFTSEEAGALKPSPVVFRFVLSRLQAKAEECLIVGDDCNVDIAGARNAGMDQMWVNFFKRSCNLSPTFEVYELKEIFEIL